MLAVYLDVAVDWQLGFQDPANIFMRKLEGFHDWVMFLLVFLAIFIGWLIVRVVVLYLIQDTYYSPIHVVRVGDTGLLEILFITIPTLLLFSILIPTFMYLFLTADLDTDYYLVLRLIGHQWYWVAEISGLQFNLLFSNKGLAVSKYFSENNMSIVIESIVQGDVDLKQGDLRLLEVNNRIVLPVNTGILLLTSSVDVIHSVGVPSLALKVDSIPGRLNGVITYADRPGVYYGMCSELCGVNHYYMPLVLQFVSHESFLRWIVLTIFGLSYT